jgi:D-sedoheptulose 7-phosphate isomerase
VDRYLTETARILSNIPTTEIEKIIGELCALRDRGGRLFFIGSGGGAAHASHAVNDFRKIACFEAYTPSDNASELTARVNDEGWESSYVEWLRGSRLNGNDMVFVFSVGGGDEERNVSANLVRCLEHATEVGAKICGIVGRNGGFTARVADACLVIPIESDERVTPQTEGIQSVVAHLLVSHPDLQAKAMRWESLS